MHVAADTRAASSTSVGKLFIFRRAILAQFTIFLFLFSNLFLETSCLLYRQLFFAAVPVSFDSFSLLSNSLNTTLWLFLCFRGISPTEKWKSFRVASSPNKSPSMTEAFAETATLYKHESRESRRANACCDGCTIGLRFPELYWRRTCYAPTFSWAARFYSREEFFSVVVHIWCCSSVCRRRRITK